MIELKNVVKSYSLAGVEEPVLKGVNININHGEMIALMGPSGSGKSTLMNLIGLLDHPTSGEYFLKNKNVSQLSSDEQAELRNKHIGFVFQSFFLLPRLTALQNVSLPLAYRQRRAQEIRDEAMKNLEKVGLAHLSHHRPSELSGGQQQRVAIARALVGDPEILLADEPTGALDSKTGQEVMDFLIELNRSEGMTVVIVTHDQAIADQCQRACHLLDGQIVMDR